MINLKNLNIQSVTEDCIVFANKDGDFFQLRSFHKKDDWENSYIAFDDILQYNLFKNDIVNSIYEISFDFSKNIPFKRVPDEGILLISTEKDKFFLSGHQENNGYYSTNMSLIFSNDEKVIYTADISACQKENEDIERF